MQTLDAPREGCYNGSPGVWLSLVERPDWVGEAAGFQGKYMRSKDEKRLYILFD